MKKHIFSFLIIAGLCSSLFAQSAEKLTEIFNTQSVTAGQTAYLASSYLDLPNENDSWEDALKAVKEKGMMDSKVSADSSVKLKEFCKVCMTTFNLKGGLIYSVTKSSHYAFKEIQAKGILPEYADPDFAVTGKEALAIFNGCASLTGGDE